MRILFAGATGQVGRRLLKLLPHDGHEVNSISGRSLDLTQALAGQQLSEILSANNFDAVISCAGASVWLASPDKRPYSKIDLHINQVLLEAALARRVPRFLYLSVHVEDSYKHTAYVRAHESFVQQLRSAPISSTVIRPTGIFSAFEDLLPLARRGIAPLIGDGSARTNPIHPFDVAKLLAQNVESGPAEFSCGGPQILSRRQINEILLASCGRGSSFGRYAGWMPALPASVVRLEAKLAGLFHPRLRELMEFFSAVATHDCIAPVHGRKRLSEFFLPNSSASAH